MSKAATNKTAIRQATALLRRRYRALQKCWSITLAYFRGDEWYLLEGLSEEMKTIEDTFARSGLKL
jgi:hypothetical protein